MANRYLTPWSGSRQWQGDPLYQLQREIDRVFDDVFSAGGRSGSGATTAISAPRIDMHDDDGELCLRADLPGIQPQDLDVRVDGDMLTISGERKSEQNRNDRDYHVMERSHGRFQRTVQLPFTPDPDQVRAEVKHGVLEVRIPKQAAQERSRRIQVRGEGEPSGGGAAMTQAVGGGSSSDSGARGAGGSRSDAGTTAAATGNVGQGPGGSSSSTPGVGSGAQGGAGGGMAGVAGGPTSAPVGESASSSSSNSSGR